MSIHTQTVNNFKTTSGQNRPFGVILFFYCNTSCQDICSYEVVSHNKICVLEGKGGSQHKDILSDNMLYRQRHRTTKNKSRFCGDDDDAGNRRPIKKGRSLNFTLYLAVTKG